MSEKFTGGKALMNLEPLSKPEPKKVLTFGETSPAQTSGQPEPDIQTPTVDAQTSGQPDIRTTRQPENLERRYRSRVERRYKGTRLPVQKLSRWELWCALNKVDFQDLVERAIDAYFGQLDNQTSRQPGVRTSTIRFDDLEDTLNDEINIFYQKLTGRPFTDKDRQAYQEVSHLAPHIIKGGILLSLMRAKTPINSFRYCIGAMQEITESGAGPDYLKYLLSKLQEGK